MKNVSIYDLRMNLATYLDMVGTGEEVVVNRFKKPIAMLVPFDKEKVDYKRFFGFMKDRRESGIAFENRIRRSAREKVWVKKARG